MGLHDLVTLKTSLQKALDIEPSIEKLSELRQSILNIKLTQNLVSDQAKHIDELVSYYDKLIADLQQNVTFNDTYLSIIDTEINSITHRLFSNNYDLEDRPGDANFVRNHRKISIADQTSIDRDIVQKLFVRTNWKYPTLEIGCRDGEWTQYLVAADPLYLIDFHQEFLDSTLSRFSPEYQRRLRPYRLINHNLKVLPAKQFGFIFSWGYFNYVSVDTMKQYLKQIHDLLRPGGIFLFTYNNGDTPNGAGMAENFSQTYMPKSLLMPLVSSLGFEVIEDKSFNGYIHWLEIKKPGTLHTIKAHQVLGEIKKKHNPISALTTPDEPSTIDNIQENL